MQVLAIYSQFVILIAVKGALCTSYQRPIVALLKETTNIYDIFLWSVLKSWKVTKKSNCIAARMGLDVCSHGRPGRRCRWVGLSNNTLQHKAQYTGSSNNTLQHKAQYTGLSNNTLQHKSQYTGFSNNTIQRTAQYTGLSNSTLQRTAQYTGSNAQFDTLVCPTLHLDTRLKGNQCGIICKL